MSGSMDINCGHELHESGQFDRVRGPMPDAVVEIGEWSPDAVSEYVPQRDGSEFEAIGEAWADDLVVPDTASLSAGRAILHDVVDEPAGDAGGDGSEAPEAAEAAATREEPDSEVPAAAADGPHVPPTIPPEEASPAAEYPDEDPDLTRLHAQAAEVMDEASLSHILDTAERYNIPIVVRREDGSETLDTNYSRKALLEEIPGYALSAEAAGMTSEQASELLVHTLGEVRAPYTEQGGFIAANLSHALDAVSQAGEPLTPARFEDLKQLVTEAAQYDATEAAIAAYTAGCKAGLSPEVSTRLVLGYLDTSDTYLQASARIDHFRDALRSLDSAGADPEAVEAVFSYIETENPRHRHETYDEITRVVSLGAADRHQTAAEAIDYIRDVTQRLAAGGELDTPEITANMRSSLVPEVASDHIPRDTYFRDVPGRIENRAVPYQTQRPWAEGAVDIAGLTYADSRRGDAVAEGDFVYDPGEQTWYSLGGQTSFVPGRVSHVSNEYDVSMLSETPISVHIHPQEFAVEAGDRVAFTLPTGADYHATATMLDRAEGRVADMRSVIAHPLGWTEFTYPSHDIPGIRNVARVFEDITAEHLGRFGSGDRIAATARSLGEAEVAQGIIDQINGDLPDGFRLKFYPHGTMPEDIE